MKTAIAALLIGCFLLLGSSVHAAERPKEALVEQVRKSIEDAKKFLRDRQNPDGSFEDPVENGGHDGGWTSLALLALLNAGEKPNAAVIQNGLKYLRKVELRRTYVVGLMTMAFAEAGQDED